jgi:hypothetical protein
MSEPKFTYRAGRRTDQEPTLLEGYGEAHIVTFLRYNMEERIPGSNVVNPNYDFGKEVEEAARLNEKIVSQLPFGAQKTLY